MNYYLNVSLVGSSTKNGRCQNVTLDMGKYIFLIINKFYLEQISFNCVKFANLAQVNIYFVIQQNIFEQ